jgi:competence protein ComEC
MAAGNITSEISFSGREFYTQGIEKENNYTVFGTVSSVNLLNKNGLRVEINADSAKVDSLLLHRRVRLYCDIKTEDINGLYKLYSVIAPGNNISASGIFAKGRTNRNPGEFDYNSYLHLYGITGIVYVYRTSDFIILNNSKEFLPDLLFRIRKSIAEKLSLYHDFNAASLMKGLLLADRSEMNDETKTEFINAGVVHVLAVSGLNVEYILLLCVILLGRLTVFPKSWITILSLIFFLLITGISASVFRAVLMSGIVIIALITGRSTSALNSMALSAFVLLSVFPFYIFDPGFQLTYSAVFSMAIFYPIFNNKLQLIPYKTVKILAQLAALSLSAQIGTIPFTLYFFGKLSFTSLAANLIVIPFIGIIVGVGIASLLFAYLIPVLGLYYGAINSLLVKLLYFIVHISGSDSFSFIRIRNFSLYNSIIYYIVLICLVYYYTKFSNVLAKGLLIVFLSADFYILSAIDKKELLTKNELNVMMIDVGQGDSFLFRFPDGQTALIDAGNATFNFDNGEKVILPLLNYLDIPVIDYAFVSHVDSDHYSGFVSLVQAGIIKKLYKPDPDTSMSRDLKFECFLKKNNIPVSYYRRSVIRLGNARIYLLDNFRPPVNKHSSNNDRSSLLKIVYGNTSFLFTGDLSKKAERFYASEYNSYLRSDVLKVSHHGSKTATSVEFLDFIRPKFSMISAGIKNKYRHPSAEVLYKLHYFNSRILRSDKLGAVLLRSDGYSVNQVIW